MLKVGLTGGIAAGKSLVALTLVDCGAVLVDADALAREVVEPGTPGLAAVVQAFGPDILAADGSLDRPALAAVVFGNEERRAVLNGIIHPLVRARAAQLAAEVPEDGILVQDIPLLVETGQAGNFDFVLVVEAPEEVRLERMVRDRGMELDAAQSRIAAQATAEQRAEAADVVLHNTGTPQELAAAVRRLWETRLVPLNEARIRAAE
ncbi:dephospho-CoA kinase [Arthrobacter sp. zg-Y769]|uniref:dephospho-CoA kinase n=1 Tax=Arthrobacter sp. zg-Y769 TaxID=2894191 RepID=UPI001E3A4FEE|nr:dephospho-CoA kinase [Arthrobacter sp. zg-Y769]MCC9204823.1 dephospho-CoA kinase [Arthrobacter sp. zg-Y769]